MIEHVLKDSINIFKNMVHKHNLSDLDGAMDHESLQIIENFQKVTGLIGLFKCLQLILKAKNDQLAAAEEKKEHFKLEDKKLKDIKTLLNSSSNTASDLVDGVIKDVAKKADELEASQKDDSFVQGQKVQDKVSEDTDHEPIFNNQTIKQDQHAPSVLIDSDNNQYVLAKPGDITLHYEGVLF